MKNQSGVVFETNCSKQMGQRKENNGLRNVFVLTRWVTVLLECKVEGDRTDTEGMCQRWN